MREYALPGLILLCLQAAPAQTVPANWQTVKDHTNTCQISVPADWTRLTDNVGAAVLQDSGNAIAVVSAQPGQEFKPLTEMMQRMLNIPKDKMFENTGKRIFYQDTISGDPQEPNAYSVTVPAKGGSCSCRITFLPKVPEDIARQIAHSLGPVADTPEGKS